MFNWVLFLAFVSIIALILSTPVSLSAIGNFAVWLVAGSLFVAPFAIVLTIVSSTGGR